MMRTQRGVTLMELMVVIVIVGILTAIAYPSYRAQVRRANRTEARVALTETAGALEKCYTRYMAYNDAANCPSANQFAAAGAGFNTPKGLYRVTGVTAATTYTLTATPQGGQATDSECMTFTVTETGTRAVTGTSSANPTRCW
jgi:type IV pilus assembly protein PilE